jgi:protease-4
MMLKKLLGLEELDDAALERALVDYLNERRIASKKERGIQVTKMFMTIVGALLFLTYVGFIIFTAQGRTVMPQNAHVAIIEAHGPIGGPASTANMDTLNPLLVQAFNSATTQAVVLHIDSPGGSPTEAQRIGRQARFLSDSHGKPFIAHIDGMGASAAYLIALYADKIVASEYSLTGSVGAVISSMNFSELAKRVGVTQQAIASAEAKTALSPWEEAESDQLSYVQDLVNQIANKFGNQVASSRGDKLTTTIDEVLLAKVYTASEAKELGLVDEINTLEQFVRDEFDLPRHKLEPRRNLYEMLVTMSAEKIAAAILSYTYSEQVSMKAHHD